MEQNSSGRDPRSYPVTEGLATPADAPTTLAEAERLAAMVIAGEVADVEFRGSADTVVTITVNKVAKGAPGNSIEVLLPVSLQPADDVTWAPTIVQTEAVPMMYPGEEVVLFLNAEPGSELVTPQPWTGIYRVQDATLRALPGNNLAVRVNGLTIAEFFSDI